MVFQATPHSPVIPSSLPNVWKKVTAAAVALTCIGATAILYTQLGSRTLIKLSPQAIIALGTGTCMSLASTAYALHLILKRTPQAPRALTPPEPAPRALTPPEPAPRATTPPAPRALTPPEPAPRATTPPPVVTTPSPVKPQELIDCEQAYAIAKATAEKSSQDLKKVTTKLDRLEKQQQDSRTKDPTKNPKSHKEIQDVITKFTAQQKNLRKEDSQNRVTLDAAKKALDAAQLKYGHKDLLLS